MLTTQAGSKLTVRVRGGEIYLGQAKILANDVVTSNGAIQIIDSVRENNILLVMSKAALPPLSSTCPLVIIVSSGRRSSYDLLVHMLILPHNGEPGPYTTANYSSCLRFHSSEGDTFNASNGIEYLHFARIC